MAAHYVIQTLFVLAGLLSLLAAAFDWDWFFTARNTQYIVARAGRNKARLFYAALGAIMMGTGIFFFLSMQECT